jgi:hypothetical protein
VGSDTDIAGSSSKTQNTGRSAGARVAATALSALIGAVVPALAGLMLLGSAALRRPVLGRQIDIRAGGAADGAVTQQAGRAAARLTLAWGTGLLLTGLVQGVMALTSGGSITDPAGMLTRTLVGLAGEALLALATLGWLRPRTSAGARGAEPRLVPGGVCAAAAPPDQESDDSGQLGGQQ